MPLLTKLFTTEMVRTDDLAIDRSAAAGENGMVRASNVLRAQLESGDRENEDRDYVEGCFGRSLYPPRELALIEQRLCTGNHLGCHLWFTRGETAQGKTMRADVQHLFDQAAEQAERNRADFLKNNDLYQSSILRLTEHIRNCMQVQQQPDAVSARQGHVDSQRIWRLPVLKDGKVFLRSEEENNPSFTVDLLLDGSASRLHCQETIAAQGYILARSWLPAEFRSASAASAVCAVIRSCGFSGFQREKRGKEKFSITLPPAGIGTDWRCAWQESCWIPLRRIGIC